MLFNPTDQPLAKNQCIIDSIRIELKDAPKFDYNGFGSETTFEDMVNTLGAPSLGIQITANQPTRGKNDNYTVRCFYDNQDEAHTETDFIYIYDSENDKMTLHTISVYKNDN